MVILTAAGCGLGTKRAASIYGSLDDASAKGLLGVLEEQRAEVQSLRGVAKMRVTYAGRPGEDPESFSTRQAVLVQAPAAFRLDALSAFGVSYTAASDGENLAVLAPSEGTIYRGRATPGTVASATGVEASPSDIAQLLLGRPPMPGIDETAAWVSRSDEGEGTIYLHAPVVSAPGQTVVVGFARAPVAGGVAVPISFERIDRNGTATLRARFEDHRAVSDRVLPGQVEVAVRGSQISLRYSDLQPNPDLSGTDFRVDTPEGMRDLPLGPRTVTRAAPSSP